LGSLADFAQTALLVLLPRAALAVLFRSTVHDFKSVKTASADFGAASKITCHAPTTLAWPRAASASTVVIHALFHA
jgi:hypothetical protein